MTLAETISQFAEQLEDAAFACVARRHDTRTEHACSDAYMRLDFVLHLRQVARAIETIEANDAGAQNCDEKELIRRCMRK